MISPGTASSVPVDPPPARPRILILSLVFAPDGVSTAQLMADLALDLQRQGHSVEVLTTQPHYNRDPVAEAAQPLRPCWPGLLLESDFHGIRVHHAAMGRKRGGFAARALGWARFHAVALVAGLARVRRPDVILVPSPLLTAGVLGWLLGWLRGAAFIYNVQELYPDLAIKLGQLRNPGVIGVLRALERFVYRRSDAVTVIGEGMRRAVVAKGVPEEKVRLVPNFVDVDWLVPGPSRNGFRTEFELGEAFVVSYAGNMGYAQGLEVLLDAAERLRAQPDILLVLVGDGVLRASLQQAAAERGLSNVRFVPHQPYARVPEIYAASDVSVVALVGGMSTEAVPSKLLRIMACARPVLALTEATSDLADEVRASGGGVVVPPEDAEAIAAAIIMLRDNASRRGALGQAGRAHVQTRYARDVVTGQYSALFREVAGVPGA